MPDLVLSLFPGIGLLDMAFEREGFCVVRGPDVLWGGDIRTFHPPAGAFSGIIGGPPCQAFSSLAHLVRANGHEPRFGNLVPEYERCVLEAQPAWFLMENVPAAPLPVVEGYGVHSFLLDNSHLDDGTGWGHEQRRVRRFSFGLRGREAPNLLRWIDLAVFVLPDAERTVTALGPEHLQGLAESTQKFRKTAVNAGHSDPNESLTAARRSRMRQPPVVSKPGLDVIGKHGKAKRKEIAAEKRSRQQTVLSNPNAVPVKIGGSGKAKRTVAAVTSSDGGPSVRMSRYRLADACRLQGLPEDFLADAPFTVEGKLKAVANGVPLPMGLAIARAIKEALSC